MTIDTDHVTTTTPSAGSRAATLGRLLLPGRPRSGAGTLAALALVAALVPVLLVVVFRAVDPSSGSWLLGLVLGLVVDILLAALALGLVAYRVTSRQLRDQRRALEKVERRTSGQDATLRRQPEVRSTVETAVDRLGTCCRRPRTSSRSSRRGVRCRRWSATSRRRTCSSCSCRSSSPSGRASRSSAGEVRYAPLTPTTLPDHEGSWYDPAALADLHDVGLTFVDGPPGSGGPQARYPTVPLLADRMAPTCAIVLDDANRRDERDVTERWLTRLEGFGYRFLPLTRGAGLFEWTEPAL